MSTSVQKLNHTHGSFCSAKTMQIQWYMAFEDITCTLPSVYAKATYVATGS